MPSWQFIKSLHNDLIYYSFDTYRKMNKQSKLPDSSAPIPGDYIAGSACMKWIRSGTGNNYQSFL
jgi:hypothetical protein